MRAVLYAKCTTGGSIASSSFLADCWPTAAACVLCCRCPLPHRCALRHAGLLLGLDGVIQPLNIRSPTYLGMRALPLPDRVASLRDPAVRAATAAEYRTIV